MVTQDRLRVEPVCIPVCTGRGEEMREYRLKCFVEDLGHGVWVREVMFPCFPYPGLIVGFFAVKSVMVCQGGLDGGGDVEVELDDTRGLVRHEANRHRLYRSQGWELHPRP